MLQPGGPNSLGWRSIALAALLALAIRVAAAHPGIRHDIDDLSARIARDPSNGGLFLERASRQRIAGDVDSALADLGTAAALGTNDPRFDLELGLIFESKGCVDEADAYLTAHLEQAPGGSAAGFLARARVRSQAGRLDEAAIDLAGAIALWPDPETYLDLGGLYEKTGRLDEAAGTYREGFERLGGAVVLRAALARLEAARGRVALLPSIEPTRQASRSEPIATRNAAQLPAALVATTVTFRQGESGYTGASDTYLEQAQPGTSFGAAATVRWDGDQPNGSGFVAYALIRFDGIVGAGPGQIPPGTTINSAILTYSVTNPGHPGLLHESLVDWTESATYTSYCGTGCDGTQIGPDVAVVEGGALGEQTVDVTASVQALVSGAPTFGWIVVPTGNDGVEFSSKEDVTLESRPLLTVTWGDPTIVERRPYLQQGTPNSMTIAWRTNVASDSRVRYGTTAGVLDHEVVVGALATNHAVTVTGLDPATKYWYDVGSTVEVHAGGTPQHFFVTSPPVGSTPSFRAWVLGDSGNGSQAQRDVRDAMLAATASHPPDLFLHMGDIAYYSGTESEFTLYHFAPYADILRNTVLWPTLGNHEGTSTTSGAPGISTGPYYTAFVLPSAGEAGGAPSGTEAYYSFDYANVHFVCLNSYQVDRGATAAMATWLQMDLAANTQPWIVAFWHHPPYTHGSHNSDFEVQHIEMRENLLPILEAGGVDLVLGGHSHGYERSYLLDGATMTPTPDYGTLVSGGYILDTGDGKPTGAGAYRKDPGIHPHQGAVYVVAGHGGADVGGPMDHPVMYFSEAVHGSVILDVAGDSITLTNVRATGEVTDTCTLVKRPPPPLVESVAPARGAVVPSLLSIEVTFDGDVSGVDASDLTVNGVPASAVTAETAARYAFDLPASPPDGPVSVVLSAGGISSSSNPILAFEGDSWSYVIGTPCVDDSPCVAAGPCRPGLCVGGACSVGTAPDGSACDDANPCTDPDSCASGACSGVHFVPAEIANVRAGADDAQLTWNPAAPPTNSYDVVRGLVHDLPVGANSETCLVTKAGAPSLIDADLPPNGDAFWYLVRGRAACDVGTWGNRGEHGMVGEKRSTSACP